MEQEQQQQAVYGRIYELYCKEDDRYYIGGTSDTLEGRMKTHKIDLNKGNVSPLYQAMRKHGVDAFEMREIATASNLTALKLRESFYTLAYKLLDRKLYNVRDGGGSYSEDARAKLSAGMVAKWQDTEFRLKQLQAKQNPATKAKVSESMKLRWQDEDYRRRTTVMQMVRGMASRAETKYKKKLRSIELKGKANGNRKITHENAILILLTEGSITKIAGKFGVHHAQISRVRNGNRYPEIHEFITSKTPAIPRIPLDNIEEYRPLAEELLKEYVEIALRRR
ncbi:MULTISPECIES: GIY-YIG nuclease family protein [Priestia]|uniref:GIY-YIG nuclease family protein n=1 Tax=Priestia TaxID=2800373 RepID=UPI00112D5A94|nr:MULTISPECIES: GIY-YIG nuclease family protein [Priestia]